PAAGETQVKQKILVVDDDAAILEVLEMRLGAMGFDVAVTSDPRKALEAVEASRFDLALLDLRMVPTDGMRLMEALHQRQPRLPVVIMTAHGTIQTAVEAVVIGTSVRLEPGDGDLGLLALFSSQAAIAIRNTHDLERLRSGAVAALGRMATQVAHEVKNPLAGLRLYVHHLEQRLARAG